MLGAGELVLILLVVLIVFGTGRLSEVGTVLPRAVKNFRAASRGELEAEPPMSSGATDRPPRRRPRLRPLGFIVIGLALLLWYADTQWFQVGGPLLAVAVGMGVVGIALTFFR
ncbi:MAG: twin-arginine translocase TatA/TatE family subunit [Chloroflexi bacterium]|nr:twin-arginine translocase TatA/TatE family subunit [Chloroflexota bacterium]